MAAGDFSASTLMDIKGKAAVLWADNQNKSQYMPKVATVLALKQEQTARVIAELEKPEKKKVVVVWNKLCSTEPTTPCIDECSIPIVESETVAKEYEITTCMSETFSVAEKKFWGNVMTREEIVADNLLVKMASMDAKINRAAVAFIEANEGVNVYDGFGTLAGSPLGLLTNVAAAQMTLDAVPELNLVGEFNYMADPFILSGTNLNVQYQLARLESGNGEGKGAVQKANEFRTYFDPVTIDTLLTPNKITYLIDRGALALATRAYHPAAPMEFKDRTWYKMASKNIPGVEYDIVYRTTCSGDEMYHQFLIKCNYAFLLNPEGCVANRTGILKFAKV